MARQCDDERKGSEQDKMPAKLSVADVCLQICVKFDECDFLHLCGKATEIV